MNGQKDKQDLNMHGWTIYSQCIVLLYSFIGAFVSLTFLLYCLWPYIGLILGVGIIGLILWCAGYGLSQLSYRTRLSPGDRERIRKRLDIGQNRD